MNLMDDEQIKQELKRLIETQSGKELEQLYTVIKEHLGIHPYQKNSQKDLSVKKQR